jgi:hypothetical protein
VMAHKFVVPEFSLVTRHATDRDIDSTLVGPGCDIADDLP